MFYGAGQEMMLRRKLEQAELQQAIELQGRRIMNLQLPDFHSKSEHHHHRLHHHRSLSLGASILSPHHQHQHQSSFSPAHFDPIIQDLSEGLLFRSHIDNDNGVFEPQRVGLVSYGPNWVRLSTDNNARAS